MDPLVAQAAQPVLARMAREAQQVSPGVAELLHHLRLHLFEVGFSGDALKLAFGRRGPALADAFVAELGLSLADYLAEAQLEIAVRLLMESDVSVARVARCLLYASPRTFSSRVVRVFGVRPRRLRLALRIARARQRPRNPALARLLQPAESEDLPPLTKSERSRFLGRLAETLWPLLQRLPLAQQQKLLRREILAGPELSELLRRRGLARTPAADF